MVVPVIGGLIYAGVYIGRFAIPVIARYVIKHGVKKAGVKFGKTVVKNARVIKQIKQLKTITKTTSKAAVKGPRGKIISKAKPKVKFKPTSKKQIAIQKKIAEKAAKKPIKKPPSKVTAAAKKSTKVPKKPTKIIKKKPSKKVITTGGKIPKIPKSKALTVFKGKKPTAAITKIAKTKKFKPGFVTGTIVGGAVPYIYNLLTKKKAPPKEGIWKGKKRDTPDKEIKPKIKPKPKPKKKGLEGGTRKGYRPSPGFISVDAAIAKMKEKESRESRKLYQTARPSATFEARVRALVAQKDKLKNVDAGDGRSEYQVRMHKLKQENKKAWKKLFTIGGKLK